MRSPGRSWRFAAPAVAVVLSGCLGAAQAQPVPRSDASPSDASAPRFPTVAELAAARAIHVLVGRSVRLPASPIRCRNGRVAAPGVECMTRSEAVSSLTARDDDAPPVPTPPDACPALGIRWSGGRGIDEASPDPGLFDEAATRRARRRHPERCCYRVTGACPDPMANLR